METRLSHPASTTAGWTSRSASDFGEHPAETAVFLTIAPDGLEEQTRHAIGSGLIEEPLDFTWPDRLDLMPMVSSSHECCAHHLHHHELRVEDLRVSYRDVLALDGVSFATSCGSCVALVGPNGAGKSTLLKAIAGLAAGARTGGFSGAARG